MISGTNMYWSQRLPLLQ